MFEQVTSLRKALVRALLGITVCLVAGEAAAASFVAPTTRRLITDIWLCCPSVLIDSESAEDTGFGLFEPNFLVFRNESNHTHRASGSLSSDLTSTLFTLSIPADGGAPYHAAATNTGLPKGAIAQNQGRFTVDIDVTETTTLFLDAIYDFTVLIGSGGTDTASFAFSVTLMPPGGREFLLVSGGCAIGNVESCPPVDLPGELIQRTHELTPGLWKLRVAAIEVAGSGNASNGAAEIKDVSVYVAVSLGSPPPPPPSAVPALSPTGLAILGLLLMALVAVSIIRRRATA